MAALPCSKLNEINLIISPDFRVKMHQCTYHNHIEWALLQAFGSYSWLQWDAAVQSLAPARHEEHSQTVSPCSGRMAVHEKHAWLSSGLLLGAPQIQICKHTKFMNGKITQCQGHAYKTYGHELIHSWFRKDTTMVTAIQKKDKGCFGPRNFVTWAS